MSILTKSPVLGVTAASFIGEEIIDPLLDVDYADKEKGNINNVDSQSLFLNQFGRNPHCSGCVRIAYQGRDYYLSKEYYKKWLKFFFESGRSNSNVENEEDSKEENIKEEDNNEEEDET